jgi:predicted PurR-regulated permease PerM
MAPAVNFLHDHKVNRSISVILIYFFAVVLFAIFIFLILPQLAQQFTVITPQIQDFYKSFRTSIQNSSFPFIRPWVGYLPSNLNSLFSSPQPSGNNAMSSLNATIRVAQIILQVLFELSVVLLIGFYWTLEGERAQYTFILLFSPERRDSVRAAIDESETRVGGFVRGQFLLALTIGLMVLIAYSILGLPSVLSLAFAAGFCELIPVFGPTLGALPALIITMASSPSKVLWVIPVTIFLQAVENHFLAPQIMKRTVRVNPIVTILAITAFGYLLGFLGVLMAIPLAAIIQVLLDRSILRPAKTEVEKPQGRDNLSKLHYETQEFMKDVRNVVRNKVANPTEEGADDVEDALESIATELDELLVQSMPPEENAS